jgi:hypothetical protein
MTFLLLRTVEGLARSSHTGVPEIDPRAKPSTVSSWRLQVGEMREGRGGLFYLFFFSPLINIALQRFGLGMGSISGTPV